MPKKLTITTRTDPARSAIMRSVKSENTEPELSIRRILYRLGYRYRLHSKSLPGKPDVVFVGRHKVIFVHGCFWHGHDCPRGCRIPKANREYWLQKVGRNKQRDIEHSTELSAQGWQILTIWECETRKLENLLSRLVGFLESSAQV